MDFFGYRLAKRSVKSEPASAKNTFSLCAQWKVMNLQKSPRRKQANLLHDISIEKLLAVHFSAAALIFDELEGQRRPLYGGLVHAIEPYINK